MNIIKDLERRIQERMVETKKPCKAYQTEERANNELASLAQYVANHHTPYESRHGMSARPARYVVFFIEGLGWTGAIDLTELLYRKDSCGGYLGLCSERGFYSY